jgi:phage gp29-like protein
VAPPTRQISFHDVPITTIAGVDSVGGINGVLAAHDMGYLQSSAMLWDAMRRDDRISGVTRTRVGALVAAPLEIKPANTKAKAARIAKLLAGDGEDEHGLWERICPPDVIKSLSGWGNALGFGLAEIVWRTDADMNDWTKISPGVEYTSNRSSLGWLPRLRVWHPQFVYFDYAERRFMVIAREGVIPLPRIDEHPEGDGKWVVWTPYGYQYGWLEALVRPLAMKYLMRQWNYRDWARSNERQGMATFGAEVPAGAPESVKDEFVARIRNLGSDAVLELPQLEGEEGGFNLKMIESTTRNWETFKEFKSQLDVDIAVAVLGQNLTTEVQGGSRAAAQVQNLVRIDKAIEDAGIADCIRQQVLTWWCLYNFGDPELAPRPEYQVEPPTDELAENSALKMLGDALTSLKAATAPIDVRTILDRAGVPLITEEEEAAQKAIAAEEAAAAAEAAAGAVNDNGSGAGDEGDGFDGPPAKTDRPPVGTGLSTLPSMRIPLPGVVKRYEFQGLPIAVENPAGSLRLWRDPGPDGGTIGTTTMLHDYGFVEGYLDGDGEEIDCYIGPDADATHVHVVHQLKAPDFKRHDENKLMLGFSDPGAAKAAYLAHRSDERAFDSMSTIPVDKFKAKLRRRTGTGKIRASAIEAHVRNHQETVEALLALAERAGRTAAVALRANPVRSESGKRRARLYADGVADKAKRLAARSLAVDLAAIKEQIDAATSWDDLRQRILVAYKGMDPKQLAGVVQKARIMANLGGRLSAIKEV